MADIGFLGLGRMGSGMAARLLGAGHRVRVWNRSREKARPLVDAGAVQARTPSEAAVGSAAIFAMLADDAASRAAWLGNDGALAGATAPTIVIECSTLSSRHVATLSSAVRDKGHAYIDCPVTGLPDAAAEGTLTLLVGAEPTDLERARPFLAPIGGFIRHFGGVGTGTAYKLVINLMGAVQIAGLAEGLRAAERLGLDRETVIAAMESSAAASPQVKRHVKRMARRNYTADMAFTTALRHKDAAYALAMAADHGISMPLGRVATLAFAAAMSANPEADEASVIDCLDNLEA